MENKTEEMFLSEIFKNLSEEELKEVKGGMIFREGDVLIKGN